MSHSTTTRADFLTQGLNPPQAEAVQHTEGPLLVLAGAGTGKTSVLTNRIAYILLTGIAKPHEILAVTFTNKAAREMAERTEKLIGMNPHGMWLGTFHRLGVRMLRAHAERVGLKPDFVILDPDDQKRVLDQLVKDFGLDPQQFPPRLVASLISRWQDNAWLPQDVPYDEHGNLANRGVQIYQEYLTRLTSLNAVDFGCLLLYPLQLVTKHADLREKYQDLFKYILVDEYQDTNAVQYLWLKALAAKHHNICVVGDDDQSIYAWRGAQVGNILKFEQDFPGAHVVRLEQNYRSTGHILAAANGVIANNSTRHAKALWTDTGNGEQVQLHPLMDDREEARFVADECHKHLRNGGSYLDLAILVRTAAQTRAIEEQFIRSGLPYTVVGGLKFYERKEIRDALAYLRLISNPADDLAFQRIVNVPKRGVGETTMATIESANRSTLSGFEPTTHRLIEAGELSGRVAGTLRSFLDQVQGWRLMSQMLTPDRLTERVLEESGYCEMLRQDKTNPDEAKGRLDNLKELVRALQDYADLPGFLEHVALVADTDTDDNAETIRMMTIHGAKGLEFDTVFLPGFEEGLFPHQRSLNEEGQKGLEEERRLAYVALTRARRRLIISFTNARRMYGQYIPGLPSRFIAEIPEEHIRVNQPIFSGPSTVSSFAQLQQRFGASSAPGGAYKGAGHLATRRQFGQGQYGTPKGNFGRHPISTDTYAAADPLPDYESGPDGIRQLGSSSTGGSYGSLGSRPAAGSRMDMRSNRTGSDYAKPAEPLIPYTSSAAPLAPAASGGYAVGQRVMHAKFGPGRILATEGKGEATTLTIKFDKAGEKKLLASLANLQIL